MPEMYIDDDGKKCQIRTLSVNNVYRRLIVDVRKEPAAEKVWKRVFDNLDVEKIWSNLNVK